MLRAPSADQGKADSSLLMDTSGLPNMVSGEDVVLHDKDLQDWLVYTNYHDEEYRNQFLFRRRRLAALELERQQLLQEVEEEAAEAARKPYGLPIFTLPPIASIRAVSASTTTPPLAPPSGFASLVPLSPLAPVQIKPAPESYPHAPISVRQPAMLRTASYDLTNEVSKAGDDPNVQDKSVSKRPRDATGSKDAERPPGRPSKMFRKEAELPEKDIAAKAPEDGEKGKPAAEYGDSAESKARGQAIPSAAAPTPDMSNAVSSAQSYEPLRPRPPLQLVDVDAVLRSLSEDQSRPAQLGGYDIGRRENASSLEDKDARNLDRDIRLSAIPRSFTPSNLDKSSCPPSFYIFVLPFLSSPCEYNAYSSLYPPSRYSVLPSQVVQCRLDQPLHTGWAVDCADCQRVHSPKRLQIQF